MSTSEHPLPLDDHPHQTPQPPRPPQARGVRPETRRDRRVHLPVVEKTTARPAWDAARWAVVLLGAAGAGLVVASYFFDWWRFWLYAPQYPGGLKLAISLTGVSGDVREIDILNHYIGMKSLAQAAPLERQLGGYGIAAVAAVSVAFTLFAGKKLGRLMAVPAMLLPAIFVADSFYWLHRFGHELDPTAPLEIGAFTPEMFGNGAIGQFATFAAPAAGFWIAIAGFVLLALGTLIRFRVCSGCARRSTCGVGCSRAMVLPDGKAP